MTLTLFQALELEDSEAVENILNARPSDVSLRDAEDRVALHYAAEIPKRDIFQWVLNADPSLIDAQDASGFTPLFVAVTAGNVQILKLLVEKGTQLDQLDLDKHTVVHWAVVCGQLETLEELIRCGGPTSTPDLHGAHPLHYAVTLDDVPPKRAEAILNALLRSENDVNCRDIDDRTPLLWASSCGNTTAVQRLVEAGSNKYATDRDNLNALHCAANHGYLETIALLLKLCNRKLLEGKDKNGDTPLFYAATYGHYECARLLLENNADPNHVDKRLRTPAHCAAAKGQMRVLKLLRQFGCSFDMQNYRGDLPFHEAVQTGNTEVVNWLLDLNLSNVSVGNFYGRTALHLSAANGDLELVKLLCECEAEPNALMIFRNQVCTSLDLAKQRQHQTVIDYLSDKQNAKMANELPTNYLTNERSNIEENLKSAKIRWNQARTTNNENQNNDGIQRGNPMTSNELSKRLMSKMQRRSSSLVEDSTETDFHLLPKSTSTTDLRLPPIGRHMGSVNKEAQTDELLSQQLGRELVEEAIRKVVGEDSWRALTNLSNQEGHKQKRDQLPKIGTKKSKINNKQSPLSDDYPQLVATDDEKAFNNYYSANQKPKRVTLAKEGKFRINEMDEDDDVFTENPQSISALLQNGSIGTGNSKQFVHERAIFQELTHLKRVQIQYGKVQERVLVRSLINNFCKMHGLNPAHFRYTSFYAWEKFLYDQLKLIYLEERDRIQSLAIGAPRSAAQFERRLRKVSPLNERLRELSRIYNSGSLTKSLSRPSPDPDLWTEQHGVKSLPRYAVNNNSGRFDENLEYEEGRESTGHGKRCACLEEQSNHSHLLLNNV